MVLSSPNGMRPMADQPTANAPAAFSSISNQTSNWVPIEFDMHFLGLLLYKHFRELLPQILNFRIIV
jgi:hypothetical protein